MQVVLNADVKKLGYRGDVVRVKEGFYRNFLQPNGLADSATKTRLKVANSRTEKVVMHRQQLLDNAKEVLTKLKGLTVTIKSKATGKGKLYGAITEADVIAAVMEASNVKLEKDLITMEHFKDLGAHKVLVHLGEDLEQEITVNVEAL